MAELVLSDFSPLREARTLPEFMEAAGRVADRVLPELKARNPLRDQSVFAWWLAAAVAQFFHERVDAEARELQYLNAQREGTLLSWFKALGHAPRPPMAAEVDVSLALANGPNFVRDTPIPRYQHFETDAGIRFVLFAGEAQVDMGVAAVSLRLLHGEYRTEPLEPSDGTRLMMRVMNGGNVVQSDDQQTVTVRLGASADGPFDEYTLVDSLHASGPTDQHVIYRRGPEGRGIFIWGDGKNGKVPAAGLVPFVSYVSGGGVVGNVAAGAIKRVVEDIVVEGTVVPVLVTQATAAEGGRAAETLAAARVRIPALWNTGDRAVSNPDHAALAKAHTGVRDATAYRAGLDTIEVAVIGTGPSGVPSSGLLDEVEERLRVRTWGGDDSRGEYHSVRTVAATPVQVRVQALVRLRRGLVPERVRPDLLRLLASYFDLDARLELGSLFGNADDPAVGHAYESDLIRLFEEHPAVQNIDVRLFARVPDVVWDRRSGAALISDISAPAATDSEEISVRFADADNFKVTGGVSGDLGWGEVGTLFESSIAALSFLITGAGAYNDLARFSISPPRGPVKLAAREYFIQGPFEAGDLEVVRG